jgi:predicted phage terminase large subunit-like protein
VTFRQTSEQVSNAEPHDPERIIAAVLKNPRAAAQSLAKYRAEGKLIDFVKLCWKVLEPGNPLRVGWAMEAICEHLEAVSKGQIRNLLINVPPGFSKSLTTGVFWPAWEWGPRDRADLRIISWSYAQHLTKRDNEKCRDLIQHPLYQALWGDRFKLKHDSNEKINYKTDKLGFRLASSIGGVGTGERGDRLILDDPHSVDGADSDAEREGTISWFGGTMTTRVRNANPYAEVIDGVLVEPSKTVIIMQRVGRRDVAGTIIDQGLDFEHLLIEMEYEGNAHPRRSMVGWRKSAIGYQDPREAVIQAIDAYRATFRQATPETAAESQWWLDFGDVWTRIARDMAGLADRKRFARPTLEENKTRLMLKLGSNAVASQFRQWPYEGTGLLFKREDFQYCEPQDVPLPGRDDCRGWDLAASDTSGADATATVRLRMTSDGRLYVMHVRAERYTPGRVDDLIQEIARADGHAVIQSFPQDPGSAGKHVISYISRQLLQGYRFRSSPEMKDKARRAEPFASQVQHHNVYLVRAPWNEAYVSELVEFPFGLHDDRVDATSRAYDALLQTAEVGEIVAPKLFTVNDSPP